MTIKLLSYNIRYGGVGREGQMAAVIRQVSPDIVVFQESTRPHVIERLSEETGMNTWGAKPGYSVGFMSRLPVDHYDWHKPEGARHPFLEIVPKDSSARVFGLHLSAIHSNWTERRRVRELRALLKGIEQHQDGFHVLVGDFNTLAPGELLDATRLPARLRALVWLSGGNIRWETIRILLEAEYVDGYRIFHPQDRGYTFPTWDPHVRLDYLFVPEPFAARLKACDIVMTPDVVREASDHFPLLAQIDIA